MVYSKSDYAKKYYLTHKVQEKLTAKLSKRRVRSTPEGHAKYIEYMRIYRQKNKEKINAYARKWDKENPRSRGSNYSIELRLAMNNVRKRDHNTCQWANCGLTHREAPIHVHHIFPRSEYPDLELIEQYMICYCANHHGVWHRYRGDNYANFILRKSKINYQRSLDFGN